MSTNTDTTTVSKVEVNLDELLGVPGAENITVPESKPNLFSRKKVDMTFIDEAEEDTQKEVPSTNGQSNPDTAPSSDDKKKTGSDIVDEVVNPKEDKKKDKTVKSPIADAINSLVKSGKLVPFEDDKPLEEYTSKDLEELIDANFAERENKIRNQAPAEFFESLPEELQVAAKYHADGGKDMKGLFRALAQAEEIHAMDHTDPKNHESIVRQFLTTTNFGTPEEIDEEIASLKDRDELEKKAAQFKPKLDKMSESIVAQKLAAQEQMQKQQAAAAKAYVGSIYKVLEPGNLNGIKLDKKTQNTLYAGLIQPNYPSISGRPTNLLGHLLEKYQYVEPRHDLIAETLWLLSDPEGYKSKLREQGKNGNVESVVRQLKTEQSSRGGNNSPVIEKEETTQRRIPRNDNFFKR